MFFFSPTKIVFFQYGGFFFQLISYLETFRMSSCFDFEIWLRNHVAYFSWPAKFLILTAATLRSLSVLLTGFSTRTQEPSLHGAPCLCQTHTLHEWYITYISYWFIIKINQLDVTYYIDWSFQGSKCRRSWVPGALERYSKKHDFWRLMLRFGVWSDKSI